MAIVVLEVAEGDELDDVSTGLSLFLGGFKLLFLVHFRYLG